jgi:ribosomal protein S18 acetylase RimI-like enzyme
VQRLDGRLGTPYRPEDEVEVSAMRERALWAQAAGERWAPMPAEERSTAEASYLAFWVAVPTASPRAEIIGTVGLRRVGSAETAAADTVEHSGLALVQLGAPPAEIGEIRRLRVAPEWRRQGVATALMREASRWSTSHGLRGLVLNTTAAQVPALALYRKLGFQEVGRSYLGTYELVWMRLLLQGAPHSDGAA